MKSNVRLSTHALVILIAVFGVLSENRLLPSQAQAQAQALASKGWLSQSQGEAQAQLTKHVSQAQIQGQSQSAQGGVAHQSEAQAQHAR